jgi:hypothetical protein
MGYILAEILSMRKCIMVEFYDTLYDTILFQKTKMIIIVKFTF